MTLERISLLIIVTVQSYHLKNFKIFKMKKSICIDKKFPQLSIYNINRITYYDYKRFTSHYVKV